MANVNILFDGTDYPIDESVLAAATAELKSHLSTAMAGSGATIKLGETFYNIDSAKLSTARDSFISHLGTIAGNGKKVTIGETEYGLDSTKLSATVSDMNTALIRLKNAGVVVLIPEGATYTVAATGKVLGPDNAFPATVKTGDIYTYGDYKYTYSTSDAGWKVEINTDVTDKNRTSYGQILENINGVDVTSVNSTFYGCTALKVAPVIPASVKDIGGVFMNCTALTTAPVLPAGSDNGNVFRGCTNLRTYTGSTDGYGDFSKYIIPASVKNLNHWFENCTSLVTAPVIPAGVEYMIATFRGCTSLKGSITINTTNWHFEHFLSGTQITEILGDCGNKEAVLEDKTHWQ